MTGRLAPLIAAIATGMLAAASVGCAVSAIESPGKLTWSPSASAQPAPPSSGVDSPCPTGSPPPHVANELLVKFREPPAPGSLDEFARRHRLQDMGSILLDRWYRFRIVDGIPAVDKAESVAADEMVEMVNLNWYGEWFATGPGPSPDPCPGWSWP